MNITKFVYVGSRYNNRCAFCKTNVSVKYIVTLDTNYPRESIVSPARVYACNKCVITRKEKANETLG